MRFLEDPFWRRIIRRVLIVAWIPALVMAAVGTIAAGSRASVAGFIDVALLLYVIFVVLSLVSILLGRPYLSRFRKGQAIPERSSMAELVERAYQAKRASKRSSKHRHERDD